MRIIHNTSFIVNDPIETEWVNFIKGHYIPSLQDNPLIRDVLFTKVSIDQPEGKTYSIQLVFGSEKDMNFFLLQELPLLEEKMNSYYKNNYLCFSSILTEI